MPFKFEELKVWQISMELTAKIDKLTKTFPKEELFVLTSQIKRAADSISLNIAEGSCLHIAKKRELINKEFFEIFYSELETIQS